MSRPFIPIPGTASVEMIYSLFSDVVENCFSVKKPANWSLTELQDLRAFFDNWHATQFYLCTTGDCLLQRIRTRALDSASSPTEDYHLPVPRSGVAGGGTFPSNVTFAIKLATGLAGRSYRGRIFIPGVCGACVAGNQVTPGAQAQYLSSLGQLITQMAAHDSTWQLCVASRYNNGSWRDVGVCTPATGWVAVNSAVDSQRRRLPGRGHP